MYMFDKRLIICLICCTAFAFWGCDSRESGYDGAAGGNGSSRRSGDNLQVNIRVFLTSQKELVASCLGGGFSITDPSGKMLLSAAAGEKKRLSYKDGNWIVDGASLLQGIIGGNEAIELRPTGAGKMALDIYKDSSEKATTYRYHGYIKCITGNNGYVKAINVLHVDDYIAGVVGAEVYDKWPMAALRAQAIASRTYAVYHLKFSKGRQWDIGSNQASQVYLGINRETARTRQAVSDTGGVILAYGEPDREKIFPAYYSAVCGGHTQNAWSVFGKSLPPLQGAPCPYCAVTTPDNKYNWATTIAKEDLSKNVEARYSSMKQLGGIVDIQIAARSDYGRGESVKLIGKTGESKWLRAEDFRLAATSSSAPLLSSWYDLADAGNSWKFVNGRGWGHGVGLCQRGAQQMAQLGKNSVQILNHYYPKAVLLRAF